MSGIDNLLDELINESKNVSSNINIIDKDDDLSESDAKIVKKALKEIEKKSKNTQEQLNKDNITKEEAQKRVKKYQRRLNKLNKQAGNKPINMKNVGKAQPRPSNNNPNNVRCFMRYNNQGNPYRVCSSGGDSKGKPPAQITKPIPVDEFLDKLGRTYGELTAGQQREYHRLDMANRRFEEREERAPIQESLDSVLKEQRRLGGFISQQARLEEAEKRAKFQAQIDEKKAQYRKKISNLTAQQRKNAFIKNQVKEQSGLTDKYLKSMEKKNLNLNVNIGRKSKGKGLKGVKEQIKDNKEDIQETQKAIEKAQGELNVVINKKPTIVSFD